MWGGAGLELREDCQPPGRPAITTYPSRHKWKPGWIPASSTRDPSCPRLCIFVGSHAPMSPLSTVMNQIHSHGNRQVEEKDETGLPATCCPLPAAHRAPWPLGVSLAAGSRSGRPSAHTFSCCRPPAWAVDAPDVGSLTASLTVGPPRPKARQPASVQEALPPTPHKSLQCQPRAWTSPPWGHHLAPLCQVTLTTCRTCPLLGPLPGAGPPSFPCRGAAVQRCPAAHWLSPRPRPSPLAQPTGRPCLAAPKSAGLWTPYNDLFKWMDQPRLFI